MWHFHSTWTLTDFISYATSCQLQLPNFYSILTFVLNDLNLLFLSIRFSCSFCFLLRFSECNPYFDKRTHKYCNFRNLLSWLLGSCRLDYANTKIFWYIYMCSHCVLCSSFLFALVYSIFVLFVCLFSEVTLMMMPCWTCALNRITRQLMIHNNWWCGGFIYSFSLLSTHWDLLKLTIDIRNKILPKTMFNRSFSPNILHRCFFFHNSIINST